MTMTTDNLWDGFDTAEAADLNRNPFDANVDPEDYQAWEKAVEADRIEQRRIWDANRTAQETDRQLVTLRGRHRAAQLLAQEIAEAAKAGLSESNRVHDGASFLLDIPPIPPAVWGKGTEILWSRGEALIIAGPQGVGKTTLAGQLLRGALGLMPDGVLGYPVAPCDHRVGYLAMDRPEQARRNLSRMFHPDEREYLAEFLRFWTGPPPTDMAADPETLVRIARQLEVDMLFVDSLKDAAIGLSKDEVGAGYNRARQLCLEEGVQLAELHHMVKNGADGKAPKQLRDVYGSGWITAGAGSVIVLWGDAGDPIVEFHHLKQPLDEVGPFKVLHNRETGLSEMHHDEDTDVIGLARRCATTGITAREAAACLYATEHPTNAQSEKARRKLGEFVAKGLLFHQTGGGPKSGLPDKWFPGAPDTWDEIERERYR